MKLPKEFAQYAAHIARANERAFQGDEVKALDALARCYRSVKSPACTFSGTGGFGFTKDSEGFIELWISPSILWGGK